MLNFDVKGNLRPYQPITARVAEMREYLVDTIVSETRIINFDKYIKYSNALKKLLGGKKLRQWIDGSFVTKKTNPKDIDFLTFIDHSIILKLGDKLDNFRPEKSWVVYGVDAYILESHPKESPSFAYTHSDILYWQEQFTRTRVNRRGVKLPKGFLEIIY